jgi:hypothetical protein
MAESLRILIAHEPRSYRDVQGAMLRELYPGADIQIAEPARIPAQFDAFAPHLVICSDLTPTIRDRAFAWVLLYPDDADLAVICIDNQQSVVQGVTMDQLLDVVERVAEQVGTSLRPALALAAEPEPEPYDSAQDDDTVPDRQQDRL